MSDVAKLLENNKQWAANKLKVDKDFFHSLSEQQAPEYLWIGCSDSRVPSNTLIGLQPGEVFVHRNIANVVVPSDLNCLSVLQYAVEVLKVKHIIVCGHYGCGGVQAALSDTDNGLIDNWLNHIRDIARTYQDELLTVDSPQQQVDILCEFNVIEQVHNVLNTTIVKNALKRGQDLTVHGWIYSIYDGILRDLGVGNAK